MFHCVFGPLLVHLCALCVPVQLYEIMMMMMMINLILDFCVNHYSLRIAAELFENVRVSSNHNVIRLPA